MQRHYGPLPSNPSSWCPSSMAVGFTEQLPDPLKTSTTKHFRSIGKVREKRTFRANECISIINDMEKEATKDFNSNYSQFFDKFPKMLVPDDDMSRVDPFHDDPKGVPRKYGHADPGCKGMPFLLQGDSVFRDNPGASTANRVRNACRPGPSKPSTHAEKSPRRMLESDASPRLPPLSRTSLGRAAIGSGPQQWRDPHHVFKEVLEGNAKASAYSFDFWLDSPKSRVKHSPRRGDSLAKVMAAVNLVELTGVKGPMALGYVLRRCFGSLEAAFRAADLTKTGRVKMYEWVSMLGHTGLDCIRICGASADALFKLLDESSTNEIKVESLVKHCGVNPGTVPRKKSPPWAQQCKELMSSNFGVKIRGDLKALTVQSPPYQLEGLTMQQARTVRLVADSLGFWISTSELADGSFTPSKSDKIRVCVTVSNEDDFVSLVCAALLQLEKGGSLVFPSTLSELQRRIVQHLAKDRGLWWTWVLAIVSPDSPYSLPSEEWHLAVYDIGTWALEVRQKILGTPQGQVCQFLDPVSSVQAGVLRMVAAESFCAVKMTPIPGDKEHFTAIVWDKASFITKAQSHLNEVGHAEVTIELCRLTPEEKVLLRVIALELRRTVREDDVWEYNPVDLAQKFLSRSQTLETMYTTSMSRISSSSKFAATMSAREPSDQIIGSPQFIIGSPLLLGEDVREAEAILTGTEIEEATPPEDWGPEAIQLQIVQRAWRRRKVVKAIFNEYASQDFMTWQNFWDLCEDRGLAELGQSPLREFFNAVFDRQVGAWGAKERGLRLEYFTLLLHEMADATAWSNPVVLQLAA